MEAGNSTDRGELSRLIEALVIEQRDRCLWYLRPDLLPSTLEERLMVLSAIEKHGDRAAYVRARELRRCLSRSTSDESAGS